MNNIQRISYTQAKSILKAQGFLIDVRSTKEYEEFHLPNSISIPLEDIYDEYEKFLPDKNAPIIVYCTTGTRSKIATVFFKDLGYKQIFDMGGIKKY